MYLLIVKHRNIFGGFCKHLVYIFICGNINFFVFRDSGNMLFIFCISGTSVKILGTSWCIFDCGNVFIPFVFWEHLLYIFWLRENRYSFLCSGFPFLGDFSSFYFMFWVYFGFELSFLVSLFPEEYSFLFVLKISLSCSLSPCVFALDSYGIILCFCCRSWDLFLPSILCLCIYSFYLFHVLFLSTCEVCSFFVRDFCHASCFSFQVRIVFFCAKLSWTCIFTLPPCLIETRWSS